MKKYAPQFLLLVAIALSVFTHSMVFDEFVMPTYGNTMIHVASARHLVEHGYYPIQDDYSYGGGVPNLYVPVFRFAYAEAVMLTGLSFDLVGRLLVILYAVLAVLGFYLVGRELGGEWAGVASAFLACTVSEFLIYTVRPLPQGLGLVLLPIAFYLILKSDWKRASFFTALVVLVHQEAGVFLVGCAFAYAIAEAARASLAARKFAVSEASKRAFACWTAGVAAYFAWHFFVMGNFAVFDLAQFQHHEGGKVTFDLLVDKAGRSVLALGAIGAASLLWESLKKPLVVKPAALFLLAGAAVGVFCMFNDLVGIAVFMDRFIVFFAIAMIPLAGYGLVELTKRASLLAQQLTR